MTTISALRGWHVRLALAATVVGVAGAFLSRSARGDRADAPFALLLLLVVAAWLTGRFLFWIGQQLLAGETEPLAKLRRLAAPTTRDALNRYTPIVLMGPFFSGFAALKSVVPDFGGWRLDPILADLDRAIFLGHTPWRVLHETLGAGAAPLLDGTYSLWLVVQMGSLFVVAAFGGERLRARFFQSWVATWFLLGCVGAIALASAGPIFSVEFKLPGHQEFEGLVESLAASPRTLDARAFLLNAYHDGARLTGSGISAAPSLHVATTTLLFLVAKSVDRRLAWPAGVFLAVICVGSVYLGWHYVMDGVLGALGATLIWWVVGKLDQRAPETTSG